MKPDNVRSYMALPNVMCVGGTWMMESAWVRAGDWARIEATTAEALRLLQ